MGGNRRRQLPYRRRSRDEDVKSANFLDLNVYPQIAFTSTHLARDGAWWLLPADGLAFGVAADRAPAVQLAARIAAAAPTS